MSAWLMLAAGNSRTYVAHDGYEDIAGTQYQWDSTVPSHGEPEAGDQLAIWNGRNLLGAGTIESIIVRQNQRKVRSRCPSCGTTKIKKRKTRQPPYRCDVEKVEFDHPTVEEVLVTSYVARFTDSWLELTGALPAKMLRELCFKPRSQLSIRGLHWNAFLEALTDAGLHRESQMLRSQIIIEGFTVAQVRVRRGQVAFRESLLRRFGAICAMTGPQPTQVLDAAHLYSYAELGKHHDGGGFMLRNDLHRLFDRGYVAIDPHTLRINLASGLLEYPTYAPLNRRPLEISLGPESREWIQMHWAQHRGDPLDIQTIHQRDEFTGR